MLDKYWPNSLAVSEAVSAEYVGETSWEFPKIEDNLGDAISYIFLVISFMKWRGDSMDYWAPTPDEWLVAVDWLAD